jgi:Rrf2 family protein
MEGLSTRGRYATRTLLYLVVKRADGPVRISDIADAEDIPQQYLEQLLIRLKVAGFVRSVRGAKGGYVAVIDPAAVTVADILAAVEGPIMLAPCQKEDCARATTCVTKALWQKASDAMNQVFATTTLKELADGVIRLAEDRFNADYSI